MTDRDNITLPREVAYQVPLHELLESVPSDARLVIDDADGKGTRFIPVGRLCREAAAILRTALAAEPTKQEPVAWQERRFFPKVDEWTHWYDCRPRMADYPREQIEQNGVRYQWRPLYAAPPDAPTVKESLTHPGYIIGSHWLETAYSRICAGEAEADVLRDCGWERVDDIKALRRDAERYRWLREKDGITVDVTVFGSMEANLDAAIDAAMEASTAPASAAADSSTAPKVKP